MLIREGHKNIQTFYGMGWGGVDVRRGEAGKPSLIGYLQRSIIRSEIYEGTRHCGPQSDIARGTHGVLSKYQGFADLELVKSYV